MSQGDRSLRLSSRYSRILLKLSGESFKGDSEFGIDDKTVQFLAQEIKQIHRLGVGVGIVVGGGNFWRGADFEARGMDRSSADHAGMLATIINALALRDVFDREKIPVRVMTALHVDSVAERYIRLRAIRHIEKGRIIILAGGTGNPYFTTDTAASLKGLDIDAEVVMMAKNGVDGVYDADPATVSNAKRFDHITHDRALELQLKAIDSTALAMARDHRMPLVVFDIFKPGNLLHSVAGEHIGTRITFDAEGQQLHLPKQSMAAIA